MESERYANGQIMNEDKKGWHYEYHADGSFKAIGKFANNEKDGVWKCYRKPGRIYQVCCYKMGIL